MGRGGRPGRRPARLNFLEGSKPRGQVPMDIIDIQVHVFLTLGVEETLAAMDALGIQGVVIDEFWSFNEKGQVEPCIALPNGSLRPISPLAQAASLKFPERFSYLQRLERTDPDLAEVFAMLGSSPGCRSIRLEIRPPAETQAFIDGGYNELLKLAQRYDLPVSVLARDTAATIRKTVARFPDVKFVVDHCGWVESAQEWDGVLSLASFKNVWLKWSHAHRAFGVEKYPYPNIRLQLARAVEAFGVQRLMWASDFTHNRTDNSWGDLLYYVRDWPGLADADKEWLLARTARDLFRWAPPAKLAAAARGPIFQKMF